MNDDRRKTIRDISAELDNILDELETVKGEEEDAFDAIPESLQESRQDDFDEAMENLDQAIDNVGDAIGWLANF